MDRNVTILADNLTITSLVLVSIQIKDKKETTNKLAQILDVTEK